MQRSACLPIGMPCAASKDNPGVGCNVSTAWSLRNTVETESCMDQVSKSHKAGRPIGGSSIPEAKAETAAAASLLETLDKRTPSRIPTGVADAKNPITVQYFRMLAYVAGTFAFLLEVVLLTRG